MKIISTQELEARIKKSSGYILIDVREKDELAYGMIPTAKSVPLSEFASAWSLEPEQFRKKFGFAMPGKDDDVIVYCRSGGRSLQAAQFLASKGYNVLNYSGSVKEWSRKDKSIKMY